MTEMKNAMKEIKALYAKLNSGNMDPDEYESEMDALCTDYGTEFIATCFIELTKEGEL